MTRSDDPDRDEHTQTVHASHDEETGIIARPRRRALIEIPSGPAPSLDPAREPRCWTRWLASFERCRILIRFSIDPISVPTASRCAATRLRIDRHVFIVIVDHDREQFRDPTVALRRHHARAQPDAPASFQGISVCDRLLAQMSTASAFRPTPSLDRPGVVLRVEKNSLWRMHLRMHKRVPHRQHRRIGRALNLRPANRTVNPRNRTQPMTFAAR